MSDFNKFKKALQNHMETMFNSNHAFFLTSVSKDDLWDTYLESFPEGTNVILKERREFDCTCCRAFIKRYGNIVIVDNNNKLTSIWDVKDAEYPFNIVSEKLSELIKSSPIIDVFISKEKKLGVDVSRCIEGDKVIEWEHFYYELPQKHVNKEADTISGQQSLHRDSKNTFKRALDEISLDAIKIILGLIYQNSLYRGVEYSPLMISLLKFKTDYAEIKNSDKDIWCWKNSYLNFVSRVRNTAIGTLLVDLSENVDIDTAVTKFEKVMAPENYKRPKAIFTKKMVEEAEAKINEMGFTDSLARRFARLDDITVNNLIYVNRDAKKKLKNSVFDDLKDDAKTNIKNFDKVESVHIDDFINNILPTVTDLEIMLEGKHEKNLMSLIAPKNKDAKTMFKWNNNFSWAYNGDIADSDIKKNVKNAGGNVDGVLRFSIQWNHKGTYNRNDYDAHCIEPSGNPIYFPNKGRVHQSSGMLDVDIIDPKKDKPAVENITWTDKNRMQEGIYRFIVHTYNDRGGVDGFSAEIEYDGQIYSFDYPKPSKHNAKVIIARVLYSHRDGIKFLTSLESTMISKEIWGIKTNNFTKVNVLMYSPNYWDGQESNGNKHYFFFIDGCKNETTPRGFFNEFLNNDLTPHRKVFEALGSKMRVEESDHQLSGVGFSSTQKNSILARVKGSFSRVIRINF